jgi:hypothetical protein
MSAMAIFLLVAFLLLAALLSFLDGDHSARPGMSALQEFCSEESTFGESREFGSLGAQIFSDEDWSFIKREESPFLDALYVQERRAVATHWLKESAARLNAVRTKHVQNSRVSKNLDVWVEARMLLLFFYLASLCWALLLMVRFVHPATPRVFALHLQSTASKLLFFPGGRSVPANVEQHGPLSS